MTIKFITKEDLLAFKSDLIAELNTLLSQNHTTQKKWLRSQEVREMFNISAGTLQNYRINGVIPFTRLGKTIYYSREDIEKLLEKGFRNSRQEFRSP